MAQYSPRKVLRNISIPLLREYFDARGIVSIPWTDLRDGDIDPIMDAVESIPHPSQEAIEADLSLVAEVANDGGSALIMDEACYWQKPWTPQLTGVKNEWERGFVVLLREPELLDTIVGYSEVDRFAESRWWRRFVGKRLDTSIESAATARLATAVQGIYKKQGCGRRCHIETHDRRNPERVCFVAYPEDLPKTDLGYDSNDRFRRHTRRTAMELYFVYRPEEGVMEMVARGDKGLKEQLAEAFCTTILGLQALPTADQRPPYDLSPLKRRDFVFRTEPEDNVERVEIRSLRLDVPGPGNKRLTYSARPGGAVPHALHDLIDEALNATRLPLDSLQVSQAKIAMHFRRGDGRRSKTLAFDVTYPDRCNLKDHGEDAVAKRCLARWGIARG